MNKRRIEVRANWIEGDSNDRIKKRFDTKKEAKEWIKVWKEFLQNVEVIEVYYNEEYKEWMPIKIDKELRVIEKDSYIMGCMSWYTPTVVFEDKEGIKYLWVSNQTNNYNIKIGDIIKIRAFARNGQYGTHLYKVQIIK